MGGTTVHPVPSCPTCCVPQVDLHGLAGDLEGCCVLLEHGGDVGLAGDREGVIQVTRAAVGGSDGGDPSGNRTGYREGSREWEMAFPLRGSGTGTTLVPIPGQYRASWMPQGDLGMQDRGSGIPESLMCPH